MRSCKDCKPIVVKRKEGTDKINIPREKMKAKKASTPDHLNGY
jgi:hypothetical protein